MDPEADGDGDSGDARLLTMVGQEQVLLRAGVPWEAIQSMPGAEVSDRVAAIVALQQEQAWRMEAETMRRREEAAADRMTASMPRIGIGDQDG